MEYSYVTLPILDKELDAVMIETIKKYEINLWENSCCKLWWYVNENYCKPSMKNDYDDAIALDDDISLDDYGELFEETNKKHVILMKPKMWINDYFVKNVVAFLIIYSSIGVYHII